MSRSTREPTGVRMARPLGAMGIEVCGVAVLALAAFLIEMLARWAAR